MSKNQAIGSFSNDGAPWGSVLANSDGKVSLDFDHQQIFVVPEGVVQLRILAVGASGGSGDGFGVRLDNGGEGGAAVSNISVNPGESLEVFVGEQGQDGQLCKGGIGGGSISGFQGGNAASGKAGGGGGGGGASGVRRIIGEELLVIAGGGGGGSGAGNGGLIGRGGAGGSFGTNGRGLSPNRIKKSKDHATRGGDGPSGSDLGNGGGGGGYYGGGAGSTCDANGGGAGDTGAVEGSMSSTGGGRGDGRVTISYVLPIANTDKTGASTKKVAPVSTPSKSRII